MEHKNETAQAKALRLLEAIYERTVTTGRPVHSVKLAATIGSTEEEALAAWRYLKQRFDQYTWCIWCNWASERQPQRH